MDAWTQSRYGGPEVIRRERLPLPSPEPGEVLIQVTATGLNAGDRHVMRGDPLLVRAVFGLHRPRERVRGMDVAGRVVDVGSGADGFAVGDTVVGELRAGLAEFVRARADRIVPVPDGVSARDAAALPIAAGTAWLALDAAGVDARSRVLVLGAAGGVGTFAVQLARSRGAEVEATGGRRALDLLAGLGAGRVHDYRTTDLTALGREPFDAVIDIAGDAPLPQLQQLVRDGGAIALVAGEGGRILGPAGRIAGAAARSLGSRRRFHPIAATPRPDITRQVLELVRRGEVRPVIDREYPFSEAVAALRHVDAGHTVGKVVVIR
ncbi:MAG: NAD(P)-dependent alcohol dehydrogenase [Microbacterium sp.]|jgi:NADPH:quinone reductase-like Zn-dependent oxidoreductase|nr:NAD(P)-dependent alcohol dehydrogenase [Microbacterium sp.]